MALSVDPVQLIQLFHDKYFSDKFSVFCDMMTSSYGYFVRFLFRVWFEIKTGCGVPRYVLYFGHT